MVTSPPLRRDLALAQRDDGLFSWFDLLASPIERPRLEYDNRVIITRIAALVRP